MGHSYFQLLTCLGLFIVAQAQDCSRPVPGANMDLKDNDILKTEFPDGTTVTFACNFGYTSAGGSLRITCTAGTWSSVKLRCKKKSCGSAGELENGNVNYIDLGSDFGDKITITCNPGYRLVGKREITCGDQGWLDRLPICEVQKCEPPPAIAHGTFSPSKEIYDYGEVVQYSCQKDLALNGTKLVSCSEDGTFTPAPPTCSNVECKEPNITHADWIEGARPPYKFKSTVRYQCRSGYKMNGADTLVCDISGQWSPGLPKCEMVTCRPPVNVADGTFSPNKASYQYKDVVEYSCHQGFTLKGSKSISCSLDGTFEPAPPTCTMVTCRPPVNVADGTFSPNKASYQYKDVVEYSCHQGFTLKGSKSISCSLDGTFEPAPPTCTKLPTTTKDTTTTTTTTSTPPSENSGTDVGMVFGILAGLGIVLGGVFAFFWIRKEKKSSENGLHGKQATKTEEELALSEGGGVAPIPADRGQEKIV